MWIWCSSSSRRAALASTTPKVLALLPADKPVIRGQQARRRAPPRELAPGSAGHASGATSASSCLSAKEGGRRHALFKILAPPAQQGWFYDEDAPTDRSERFLASGSFEKSSSRLTGDELPYTSTVVIDKWRKRHSAPHQCQHRGRARGPQGHDHWPGRRAPQAHRLRGAAELQTLMDARIHLELWVKVRRVG